MKKVLLALLAILVLALISFKAYLMIMPEVIVSNQTATIIKSVTIQLPSNRIVFGVIAPNSSSAIFYSLNQADGTYKYSITFETGETISNVCGYITDNEVGKLLHIIIKSVREVKCSGNEV